MVGYKKRIICSVLVSVFMMSGCGADKMVAHDEPYGYIEALEAVIPDIKDKREINGIVNRFERYTELLFVSPGDEKDNLSWITVGVADAGKKINTVQLSLFHKENAYEYAYKVIGCLVGEDEAVKVLDRLKIDKESGYQGKEFESITDLPTYDYNIGNLGLPVEFYIMVKNKDYDDSSIFSQMRGR